jgi:hypothetical protein
LALMSCARRQKTAPMNNHRHMSASHQRASSATLLLVRGIESSFGTSSGRSIPATNRSAVRFVCLAVNLGERQRGAHHEGGCEIVTEKEESDNRRIHRDLRATTRWAWTFMSNDSTSSPCRTHTETRRRANKCFIGWHHHQAS